MIKQKKAYKILFFSKPYRGHANRIITIAEEMVQGGYNCTFAIEYPATKWIKHIRGISIMEIESNQEVRNQRKKFWKKISKWTGKNPGIRGEKEVLTLLGQSLGDNEYYSLYTIFEKVRPDLVIVERAMIAAMDICTKYQIPYVEISGFLNHRAPIPKNQPIPSSSRPAHLNIFERILNRVDNFSLQWHAIRCGLVFKLRKLRRKHKIPFYGVHPSEEALKIVTSCFGLELSRTLPQKVHLVGPVLPKSPESLSINLKRWFASSKKNVLYISFGSLAHVDQNFIDKIINAFKDEKLNIRILWAIPSEQIKNHLKNIPNHFRIENYVPQLQVLNHPKVKLFLTHCGMNSVTESIYFGVPIIGCPYFCDQYYWAQRIKELGVGLTIDKVAFQSFELKQKALRIMHLDPSFRNRMQKESQTIKSAGGLKQAINLIESFLYNNQYIISK